MEKIVKVYSTKKYEIFKRLKGNRSVENKRVAIIKDSIEQIGYIPNPIIVNENMEVIDGQGRLEALKQLNMPIEYTVVDGLGINECRAMNLKPTSWKADDFVKSYAEYGNENYLKLIDLNDKYKLSYSTILTALFQRKGNGGSSNEIMRNGSLVITDEDYDRVESICKYLVRFSDIQKKIGGRKEAFYSIIAWIAQLDGVDLERLCVSMHQQHNKILPIAQAEPTLRQISEVYNHGYSKKTWRMFEYDYKINNDTVMSH